MKVFLHIEIIFFLVVFQSTLWYWFSIRSFGNACSGPRTHYEALWRQYKNVDSRISCTPNLVAGCSICDSFQIDSRYICRHETTNNTIEPVILSVSRTFPFINPACSRLHQFGNLRR